MYALVQIESAALSFFSTSPPWVLACSSPREKTFWKESPFRMVQSQHTQRLAWMQRKPLSCSRLNPSKRITFSRVSCFALSGYVSVFSRSVAMLRATRGLATQLAARSQCSQQNEADHWFARTLLQCVAVIDWWFARTLALTQMCEVLAAHF